jgi:hypothetical protein
VIGTVALDVCAGEALSVTVSFAVSLPARCRRADHEERHPVGVADMIGDVVAVLRVVLGDHEQRVVLVRRVAHQEVDDVVGVRVAQRYVLKGAGVVVEQLDVTVGGQAVRRHEAPRSVHHRRVGDALVRTRVPVVPGEEPVELGSGSRRVGLLLGGRRGLGENRNQWFGPLVGWVPVL